MILVNKFSPPAHLGEGVARHDDSVSLGFKRVTDASNVNLVSGEDALEKHDDVEKNIIY